MNEPKIHKSVMVDEAIAALHVKNQALYIDGTLGTGGHSYQILAAGGKVLGIDMDPAMIKISLERVSGKFDSKDFVFEKGNFTDMARISQKNSWTPVSGILLDLGVSNLHLKDEVRGFSFANPETSLDMRLDDNSQGVSAADLLNVLRGEQLTEMFMVTMEGGPARWLSARVMEFRKIKLVESVGDFLEICKGLKSGKTGLSEATLPFLALRIAVNSELDNLSLVLPVAYKLLEKDGRLVVISFHSGEDKIVKDFVSGLGNSGKSEMVVPGLPEVYENPRARSAKMRVIIKT